MTHTNKKTLVINYRQRRGRRRFPPVRLTGDAFRCPLLLSLKCECIIALIRRELGDGVITRDVGITVSGRCRRCVFKNNDPRSFTMLRLFVRREGFITTFFPESIFFVFQLWLNGVLIYLWWCWFVYLYCRFYFF